MSVHYRAGTWLAAVHESTTVLLAPEVRADIARQVWTQLEGGADGFTALIESLAPAYGMRLGDLPAFAVVSARGSSTRVIARGDVTVMLNVPGAADTAVLGSEATTWVDRNFDAVSGFSISVAAGAGELLALSSGVVYVCEVSSTTHAPADVPAQETVDEQPVGAAHINLAEPIASGRPVVPTVPPPPADGLPESTEGVPIMSLETLAPLDHSALEAPTAAAFESDEAYDELLFGETRLSTTEDAAVRTGDTGEVEFSSGGLISSVPPISTPTSATPLSGDHDGETISAEQLAAMRGEGSHTPATPIASQPAVAPATLLISNGERYVLDRGAVIGRRPQAIRSTGTLPHLVAVPSPAQDISRSHLELRVEGSDVLATDLDTTNGTRLLRLGKDPVRLHPGEATLVVPGDRFDLGDGVIVSFEGLP